MVNLIYPVLFQEAIHYYEQDLELAKDLQDRLSMGRAYCNLGLSHLALGNFQAALECQRYFLAVAQMMKHLQVSMFCKTG